MTRRATVLVADDDVAYGSALRTFLERDGHAVHQVLDGAEALRRVHALGSDLDVILLDLLLPKKTGFEVVKELAEEGCTVPVLVMTGVHDSAREIHALRGLGVSGWIHKSAPLDHFVYRVRALLHPRQRGARGAPRVVASLPVTFTHGARCCYAATYNVSESGVYVRTNESPAAGEVVEMVLTLPTAKEPVHARVEIVHVATPDEVQGTAYPAGFGARFVELSPLAAAAIRGMVNSLHAETAAGEVPAGAEPNFAQRVTV